MHSCASYFVRILFPQLRIRSIGRKHRFPALVDIESYCRSASTSIYVPDADPEVNGLQAGRHVKEEQFYTIQTEWMSMGSAMG